MLLYWTALCTIGFKSSNASLRLPRSTILIAQTRLEPLPRHRLWQRLSKAETIKPKTAANKNGAFLTERTLRATLRDAC